MTHAVGEPRPDDTWRAIQQAPTKGPDDLTVIIVMAILSLLCLTGAATFLYGAWCFMRMIIR